MSGCGGFKTARLFYLFAIWVGAFGKPASSRELSRARLHQKVKFVFQSVAILPSKQDEFTLAPISQLKDQSAGVRHVSHPPFSAWPIFSLGDIIPANLEIGRMHLMKLCRRQIDTAVSFRRLGPHPEFLV